MVKVLSELWVRDLRYKWSYIRHQNSPKTIKGELLKLIKSKDLIPDSLDSIVRVANALYLNFEYINDGIDRLYDSIDSPASCLERALINSPLKDDCDGFHSAFYGLVDYNFDCRLFTVVTKDIKRSHTMLVVKPQKSDNYIYLDYTYKSPEFINKNGMVAQVKTRLYEGITDIIHHEFSKWDGSKWISSSF